MDTFDYIATKLDIRQFSSKAVPSEIKLKVLEAGRLTGSGMNVQHWHFILVQNRENLKKLSQEAPYGRWLENSAFAVIILTDPQKPFHEVDAGRALQDMQLCAWSYGVASCITRGVNDENLRATLGIPKNLHPAIVLGFGYPASQIKGKKNRKPLSEVASLEKYGNPFDAKKL